MITNGFTYIAVLVFIAALLVWLQRYTKSKFFDYAPPIVLLYLITMILCTLGAWDMEATKPAYSVLKNNLLYAMIFLMLLRCDIRKIIKLGPKMLGGFFAASVSHLVGLHCHLRHHEGAPWRRSMEGTGRSVRQLDGRLRQHDRRAGCAGHRRS